MLPTMSTVASYIYTQAQRLSQRISTFETSSHVDAQDFIDSPGSIIIPSATNLVQGVQSNMKMEPVEGAGPIEPLARGHNHVHAPKHILFVNNFWFIGL